MGRIAHLFGLDYLSTWMIVFGLIIVAITEHPSLLSLLLIGGVGGWQFLTREMAHYEVGGMMKVKWPVVALAGIAMLLDLIMMTKINWLAI